jgi:AcrR family transcriptional regulator
VFAEAGLDASMELIARHAGVAVGTLYNHFADRAALMRALFEARHAALRERLQAALDAAGPTLPEQLKAFASTLIVVPEATLRFRRMMLQEPLSFEKRKVAVSALAALLAPVLDAGRQSGELRDDPLELQAGAFMVLVHRAMHLPIDRPDLPLPALVDEVVRQFLDGARGRA